MQKSFHNENKSGEEILEEGNFHTIFAQGDIVALEIFSLAKEAPDRLVMPGTMLVSTLL
ncbi:hypothetical protein GT2_03_02520 [Parageobacillus thermoglucosidasius NBRC 107763]|nr:hypothetical protein GT2_03_02520 [Parageobacillus thermoglucosidasius NBRC 107763]